MGNTSYGNVYPIGTAGFHGKTVKPFVTHEGSGFGTSQKDLDKLCKGAEIKRGLSIPGANVASAKDTVEAWIKE